MTGWFRHVVVKEDLSEFLNDGSWRRGYNVNRYAVQKMFWGPLVHRPLLIHNAFLVLRVYHHCRTCLPLLQDEVEQEKEEKKKALQWQQISSEKVFVVVLCC